MDIDLEGIRAADAAQSIKGQDADGEGKAGGGNTQKPPPRPESFLDVQPDDGNSQPSSDPKSLDVELTRPPVLDSPLRARKLPEPADRPAQTSILEHSDATKTLSPEVEAARAATRADRRNQPLQRDDGQGIRERKN